MNFLADESVDKQIVERLRQDGHSVRYVAEMDPGISDDAVLDLADHEATLLLTVDKDFAREDIIKRLDDCEEVTKLE